MSFMSAAATVALAGALVSTPAAAPAASTTATPSTAASSASVLLPVTGCSSILGRTALGPFDTWAQAWAARPSGYPSLGYYVARDSGGEYWLCQHLIW